MSGATTYDAQDAHFWRAMSKVLATALVVVVCMLFVFAFTHLGEMEVKRKAATDVALLRQELETERAAFDRFLAWHSQCLRGGSCCDNAPPLPWDTVRNRPAP